MNTNPALSNIEVSAGKLFPAFRSDLLEYSVDLPLRAAEFHLTPTAAVPEQTVIRAVNDVIPSGGSIGPFAAPLNMPQEIVFSTQAGDGTKRIYRIVVRRTLTVQATIRSAQPATSFGDGLALHGDSLIATRFNSADQGRSGTTVADLHLRSGGQWTRSESIDTYAAEPKSLAMNSDWVVVVAGTPEASSNEVHFYERELLPYRAVKRTVLPPSGTSGFGKSVALAGSTLAVTADERGFIFGLAPKGALQQAQIEGLAATVALEGDLAVFAGSDRAMLYGRSLATWKPAGMVGGGTIGTVDVFSGRIAMAELYACLFGCAGLKPTLHVFEPSESGWKDSKTTIPALPDVPASLDPNGFGTTLAYDEGVIFVGAPLVRGLRSGVHRNVDPATVEAPSGATSPFGAVYIFVELVSGWILDSVLGPLEESAIEAQPSLFGAVVAFSQGRVAVSAPRRLDDTGAGAVYIFGPDCSRVPADAEVPGCP